MMLDWETIRRLSNDLREAGRTLGRDEARFLVDAYYRMQEQRMRFDAQVRECEATGEPHDLLKWFAAQSRRMENELKRPGGPLDYYSLSRPAGRWARSVCGVGPVIAAGLLSHIDLMPWKCKSGKKKRNLLCRDGTPCTNRCGHQPINYAGQVWSFAGMDPSKSWKKGKKRPWNAELKTLCYKLGESFVKVKSNPNGYYGHLFTERKERDWERNLNGENTEAAASKAQVVDKKTVAYKWYSGQVNPNWARKQMEAGKSCASESLPKAALKGMHPVPHRRPMLPPAHIHARARRWTAKLFLSHLFETLYVEMWGREPEVPFVLTMDNHSRRIAIPGYDEWLAYEGVEL